jgi:hypothetical protein
MLECADDGCAGHFVMSFGIGMSELLQSVQHLESLAKARLAERRKGAGDPMRTQLLRYGVCTCPCHFTDCTVHSGEPCCGNARLAE